MLFIKATIFGFLYEKLDIAHYIHNVPYPEGLYIEL